MSFTGYGKRAALAAKGFLNPLRKQRTFNATAS
jgi:hypothetical protein